jgi:hypothetical protein
VQEDNIYNRSYKEVGNFFLKNNKEGRRRRKKTLIFML